MRLRSKIDNSLSNHILRMGLIGQTYCELRAPSEWALKSKNNNTQMKLIVNIVGKKGYQDRF